jgi:predicted nucleic acid-binding protein
MKHLYLDTNIILDVVLRREPFLKPSAKILDLQFKNRAKLYLSSLSYTTIYYVLRKTNTHSETILLLKKIFEKIETIDVTNSIIKKSLYSEFSDFEDAVQYYTAISNKKIEAIITRNPKDFKKSELLVMPPEEFLSL